MGGLAPVAINDSDPKLSVNRAPNRTSRRCPRRFRPAYTDTISAMLATNASNDALKRNREVDANVTCVPAMPRCRRTSNGPLRTTRVTAPAQHSSNPRRPGLCASFS